MNDFDSIRAALELPEPPLACAVGASRERGSGPRFAVQSPIDGRCLAEIDAADPAQARDAVAAAEAAFPAWRDTPPPARGDFARRLAAGFRARQTALAALVTLEVGKIGSEAWGEVQEAIDICDFAAGLSRQLYGRAIASERPEHRLAEQWHPLGPIGCISAFNFPVAVWAWNAALAFVCGDPVVWKPSEKAPLCALACHQIVTDAAAETPGVPDALASVVVGGSDAGQALADSRGLPLVSATGSVRMGRAVAQRVAARLGRTLLELGGNNAAIVAPSADLDMAMRSIVFAAVGTCGQRCTSLRRLIVHRDLLDEVRDRLLRVYARLPIGDPRLEATRVGPLIDRAAAQAMDVALESARAQGGRLHGGGALVGDVPEGGAYVRPAVVEIDPSAAIVAQETFAPILYLSPYSDLDQAIAIQNAVPQGLSSAIFTRELREAERFCAPGGSDCGIANVNIGTSGAEIGGAFGGEKDTGGGRESGSDAWKAYMRRATNTVNFGNDPALAQGIRFDL